MVRRGADGTGDTGTVTVDAGQVGLARTIEQLQTNLSELREDVADVRDLRTAMLDALRGPGADDSRERGAD